MEYSMESESTFSESMFGEDAILIPPVKIDNIRQPATSIVFLTSPEQHVILAALCSLNDFTNKNDYAGVQNIFNLGYPTKCLDILSNHNFNCQLHKMALKLLFKIIKYNDLLKKLPDISNIVDVLIDLFINSSDEIIMEYCTYILIQISRGKEDKFCKPNIMKKIFTTIAETSDPDVLRNCLRIILMIVNRRSLDNVLISMKEFQINLLNDFLMDPLVRPVIVDIFLQLSNWKQNSMHRIIFDTNTVKFLFEVLMESKWTSYQDKVFNIILNCAKHYECQCKNITSKEFLAFFNFAKVTSIEHAKACVTLVAEFSKSSIARRTFFNLGIHREYGDFFKMENSAINSKICEGLAHLCSKCFIPEERIHEFYIQELARILENSDLAWVPFRQAPIYTLHAYLMANPKLSMVYYKNKITKHIKTALLHRSNIEKSFIFYIMEIYQILLLNEYLYDHLLTPKIFDIFYHKFEKCLLSNLNENLVYLNVMYLALKSETYRKIFLENKGYEVIFEGVKANNKNINMNILEFIKQVCYYKDISCALLRTDIVRFLSTMGDGRLNQRKILCKRILEQFYSHDIIFKFYDKKELEISDIIKTRFLTYLGKIPSNSFPLLEVRKKEKLLQSCTVLVVDLIEEGPSMVYNTTITESSTSKELTNKTSESTNSSFENSLSISSSEDSVSILRIYDSRLQLYLEEIKYIFETEMKGASLPQKIERIATFITCYVFNENKQYFTYEEHINSIKLRIKSNYIPIGYIRIGTIIERAVLFKVIADQFKIPCTLMRHKFKDNIIWNEVLLWTCELYKPRYEVGEEEIGENYEENEDFYYENHNNNSNSQNIFDGKYSNVPNAMDNKEDNSEETINQTEFNDIEMEENMELDEETGRKFNLPNLSGPKRCMSYYIVDLLEDIGSLYAVDTMDAFFYREQIPKENRQKYMTEMENSDTKTNKNFYSYTSLFYNTVK